MAKNKFWIGIGSSAGGLDALKVLLENLKYKNAIYIIAQHLDPTHPTILKELLEKVTVFPIHMLDKDIEPKEGSIYIISPGCNAIVKDGFIRLSPAALIGPKPSVNELFCSMADELKEYALGIILSGTGSDGATGITAIKAAGGITIAQDSQSSKYSGMPQSATQTGFVDLVLSPKEIADELPQLIKASEENSKIITAPKIRTNLEQIFQAIFDQTSYDFSGYKQKTIQRRIQRRMVVNKYIVIDEYVKFLKSSSEEVEALYKDLLISVTDFFRDDDPFEDLKIIVDDMIYNRANQDSIRIWVAGCANGAEAYSLAILFKEANKKYNKDISFQIFATDIDDYALNLARKAVYQSSQVKNISDKLLKKYFLEKDTSYIVNKSLRDHVVFAKQNLISDPPFSSIDLISCRNVLIYFNSELQKKIFQIFHYALKPNCYLFSGTSESAANTSPELFEASVKRSQIFKRRQTEYTVDLDYVKGAKKLVSNQKAQKEKPNVTIKEEKSMDTVMREVILSKLIPASIVVNSIGGILNINGNLNAYLELPQGKFDANILSMARDDLKVDLRSLLQKAKRDGTASSQALFFESIKNDSILHVCIERMEPIEDDLYVIVFFELLVSENKLPTVNTHSLDSLSKDKLKQEIEVFRERLQSTVQDLETSNEEFQSTNEELQSTNEELQSSNEELQTSNEELQSTNEELSTVNEELEVKSFELGKVNNDLSAMLSSIDENIIFVDNRLRLQRYTNKAGAIFELFHDDLGQVITSFGFSMDIPNLRSELIAVIEREKEVVIKLRSSKIQYDLRIVPYKFDNHEIVGAILFFEKSKSILKETNNIDNSFTSLLGKYTQYAMLCIDSKMSISYFNLFAEELFGYTHEEFTSLGLAKIFFNIEESNIENRVFNTSTLDSNGWSSITVVTKDKERIIVKYKFEEYPLDSIVDRVIFFKHNS